MAAGRQAIELAIGEEDLAALGAIARSRSEPASRVERARMLLAYREDPSFFKVGRVARVHHQTVQRCVERALAYGPLAALDDRPRPGKEQTFVDFNNKRGGIGRLAFFHETNDYEASAKRSFEFVKKTPKKTPKKMTL